MNDSLDSLLHLQALDRLPRTGWIQAGIPAPESIAGHLLGVAHLALALGPRVDPPVNMGEVLTLCLVHDAPEAWLGDLPRSGSKHLPTGAKATAEHAIAEELLGPLGPDWPRAFWHYQAGDSREARLVKLCDKLQLGIRLLGYLRAGQGNLDSFLPGLRSLDCSEFPPAAAFHRTLLGQIDGALG